MVELRWFIKVKNSSICQLTPGIPAHVQRDTDTVSRIFDPPTRCTADIFFCISSVPLDCLREMAPYVDLPTSDEIRLLVARSTSDWQILLVAVGAAGTSTVRVRVPEIDLIGPQDTWEIHRLCGPKPPPSLLLAVVSRRDSTDVSSHMVDLSL